MPLTRIFHQLQRVFLWVKNPSKGHELKNYWNAFLLTCFNMFSKIKLCYVNIGWPVTGGDLLYFSQHKSPEGQEIGRGSEGNNELRNISGQGRRIFGIDRYSLNLYLNIVLLLLLLLLLWQTLR